MNLLAYIQGKRRGKEAHHIERKAMEDPFLADALEGFDAVEGEHAGRITAIRTRLSVGGQKSNRKIMYISIAASLLLCVSLGGYFLVNSKDEQALIAKSDLPVRDESATENNILTEKDVEEDKQVAGEILEDLNLQTQDNAEIIERRDANGSTSSAASSNIIEQEEIIVADESPIIVDEPEIILPDIAAAEVSKDDTLMVAQAETNKQEKEATKPGRVVTSSNSTQRALTTSGSSRKPEPKIGMNAYKKYLKESMVRPKEGDCAKKKGNVIVEFKINAEGKPHSFVFRKKLCEDLDKEAVRLIENGPVWVGDTDKSVMLEVKF